MANKWQFSMEITVGFSCDQCGREVESRVSVTQLAIGIWHRLLGVFSKRIVIALCENCLNDARDRYRYHQALGDFKDEC